MLSSFIQTIKKVKIFFVENNFIGIIFLNGL